jgi:predicted nucleic acid-binding protein
VSFVLDASVALAWCFDDQREAEDLRVLETLRSGEAIVPAVWGLEVVNALLVAERRGRLDAGAVERFVAMLLNLPLALDPASRSAPFRAIRHLARAHRLTSYDAAYLELAMRMALPLATKDAQLRGAAEREGVPAA